MSPGRGRDVFAGISLGLLRCFTSALRSICSNWISPPRSLELSRVSIAQHSPSSGYLFLNSCQSQSRIIGLVRYICASGGSTTASTVGKVAGATPLARSFSVLVFKVETSVINCFSHNKSSSLPFVSLDLSRLRETASIHYISQNKS